MQNYSHCSTLIEVYTTVSKGCGAELETLALPREPFSFIKFIKYFVQVFIISILIAVFLERYWVLIVGLILGIIHSYDKAKSITESIRYVWNR